MKKSAKRQYLNEGGIKCPYCRSEDLKSYAVLTTVELLLMHHDVYTLTNILTEN